MKSYGPDGTQSILRKKCKHGLSTVSFCDHKCNYFMFICLMVIISVLNVKHANKMHLRSFFPHQFSIFLSELKNRKMSGEDVQGWATECHGSTWGVAPVLDAAAQDCLPTGGDMGTALSLCSHCVRVGSPRVAEQNSLLGCDNAEGLNQREGCTACYWRGTLLFSYHVCFHLKLSGFED